MSTRQKFLLFISFLFMVGVAYTQQNYQDVVYLKNGSIIRGIIIEQIPNKSLKIETVGNSVFVFEIDEIEKITKEIPPVSVREDTYFTKNKNEYISIGPGYGNSYGGIGARFQQRFGKKIGFGYHAGLGYFPGTSDVTPSIWYNGGAKFFWYKAWYLNLTYGTIARYSTFDYDIGGLRYGDIYGSSILIGGDFFFNHVFGMNGALGTSFNITNSNYYSQFLTLDLGFIFKF